jgi:hypothetical protein
MLSGLFIAPIDRDQALQPPLRLSGTAESFADVSQRLERDDVLVIEPEDVRKGSLGSGQITLVPVTPPEDDARRYVIGVELQTALQQL